jgi:hypothetical protein
MKKLLAFLTAAVMTAALAVPVMAENYGVPSDPPGDGTTSTKGEVVKGGEPVMYKYLITDEGTTVPDVEFGYKITNGDNEKSTETNLVEAVAAVAPVEADPDNGIEAQPGKAQVYWGIDPDKVKIKGQTLMTPAAGENAAYGAETTGKVVFSPEALSVGVGEDTDEGQNYISSGMEYSKAKITLDFSEITFPEPGIYRYYLEEEDAGGLYQHDTFNSHKSDADFDDNWKMKRTIDVYVLDEGEGLLNPDEPNADKYPYVSTYVIYEGRITGAPNTDVSDAVYDVETDWSPFADEGHVGMYSDRSQVWKYPYEYATGDTSYTGDTYEYTFDYYDGKWIETKNKDKPTEVVTVNVDESKEELQNSYGKIKDNDTEARNRTRNAGEAFAMGAQPKDIKYYEDGTTERTWTYTDPDNTDIDLTATWSDDDNAWAISENRTGTADHPSNTASAYYDNSGTETEGFKYQVGSTEIWFHGNDNTDATTNNTYDNIKNTRRVTDSVIRTYVWIDNISVIINGQSIPATKRFVYNSADGIWNTTVTVDYQTPYEENGVVSMPDGAETDEDIVLDYILFKYAAPIEKAAQTAVGFRPQVILETVPNGAEVDGEVKNGTFVNQIEAVTLKIGKEVKGNQASRDKYFKFTVRLSKPYAENLYIDLKAEDSKFDAAPTANAATDYEASDMAAANGRDDNTNVDGIQYQFDDNAKAKIEFYLQGGQYVTLMGVPAGTIYTVEEAEANTDGYVTTALVNRASGDLNFKNVEATLKDDKHDNVPVSLTSKNEGPGIRINHGDHTVTFTNTKNGVVPTGVAVGIGAAAALVGIVVVYIIVRRRTRYAYEDEE